MNKQKLVDALSEIDMQETSNETLVEMLLAKLKDYRKEIKDLKSANAAEKQQLHDLIEQAHNERNEMRRNPNKFISTTAYFVDASAKIKLCVNFDRGNVGVVRELGGINFLVQQVSPDDYRKYP